jgi:hypothetical protein
MCQNHNFQVTKLRNFEKPKKTKQNPMPHPPKKKTTTGLDIVLRMG